MATTYLTRTPSSAGSNTVWTVSMWVKRASLASGKLNAAGTSSTYEFLFNGSGGLTLYNGAAEVFTTTRLFRDTSAWYHIVLAYNTTASGTDKCKLYINGTLESSFSTDNRSSAGAMSNINQAVVQYIGKTHAGGFFDGLMSHFNSIDGTQYAASEFGETDSTTGEWKIKTSPSVTYGTNGFFILKDGNSVTDQSGNSNNFTVGGGTLTKTEDCPDNNFATLNPVYKNFNQPTFTLGNNTTSSASGGYFNAFSSIAVSTGKYYAEIKRGSSESQIGISSLNDAQTLFPQADYYIGETSKSLGISNADGKYRIGTTGTTYGSSYTTGDIIGLALDLTNKKLYASKNGAWANGSGTWDSTTFNASTGAIDISAVIPSGEYAYIGFSIGDPGTGFIANFGFPTFSISSGNADDDGYGNFEYDVPGGYFSLNTKNLAEYG
jgi:hypothetical protein